GDPSGPSGDSQRDDGESSDAVEGELQHLAEWIMGLAREAALAIVEDRRLPEADPRDHSPHEPARLTQRAEREHDAAAHQAEVPRVDVNVEADDGLEHPIEKISGGALEERFLLSRAPHAV